METISWLNLYIHPSILLFLRDGGHPRLSPQHLKQPYWRVNRRSPDTIVRPYPILFLKPCDKSQAEKRGFGSVTKIGGGGGMCSPRQNLGGERSSLVVRATEMRLALSFGLADIEGQI